MDDILRTLGLFLPGPEHPGYRPSNPGQPFTVYNHKKTPNHLELAQIYDRVLYQVSVDHQIDLYSAGLFLLGFGFGAVIALSYGSRAT
jgi:hypothetical protein